MDICSPVGVITFEQLLGTGIHDGQGHCSGYTQLIADSSLIPTINNIKAIIMYYTCPASAGQLHPNVHMYWISFQ